VAWFWRSRIDNTAHPVQGRDLCAVEGRRWTSHPVLQWLPSSVLLPYDGRNGIAQAASGYGDGDARRQYRSGGSTLHTPVAMEKVCGSLSCEGGRTVGAGTISEIPSNEQGQGAEIRSLPSAVRAGSVVTGDGFDRRGPEVRGRPASSTVVTVLLAGSEKRWFRGNIPEIG